MKKLYYLSLAALSCTSSLLLGKIGVGFELVNRSSQPVWASIINGDPISSPDGSIRIDDAIEVGAAGTKNSTLQQKIDLSKTTKLALWLNDPRDTIMYHKATLQDKTAGKPASYFIPTPHAAFSFPVNKTIYISWDKIGAIRPQKGPLKGLMKKTESNLSLENNISEDEIRSAIQKVA